MTEEQRARMELIKQLANSSPYYKHIGMALVDYDDGISVLEMPFDKTLANLYGIAHGGAIASAADSACGLALGTRLDSGQTGVTIDMRVNYISPFTGGTLVARGELIHKGSTTAVMSARLTQDDRLVAVAMVVHYLKMAKQDGDQK